MKWYQIDAISDAVVGVIAYGLFGLVFWYFGSRWKLNIQFNTLKPRVKILLGLAVFCVLFGALSFKTFIVEKFDFRGKWDAYQFRKTMIDDDAFQKPIDKNIAEIGE